MERDLPLCLVMWNFREYWVIEKAEEEGSSALGLGNLSLMRLDHAGSVTALSTRCCPDCWGWTLQCLL